MYEADDQDGVIELDDVPEPDIGAPLPHLVCAENRLVLAYHATEPDPDWDGTYVKIVGPETEGTVAIVTIQQPYAHMFGPPNDEAFHGHPLASRGLRPYAAFEINRSSWLRGLERMNSVHPSHNRERFLSRWKHFVFAFHDSTFECIAQSFSFEVVRGSMSSVMPRMIEELH